MATDSSPQSKLRFMILAFAMLAVASLIATMLMPHSTNLQGHIGMLSLHLLMELFAIIIAMLVVNASWHTFDIHESPYAKVLICGFLIVACCDMMHALSYKGMPAFLTGSSTPKAIYFWLMGRTFEVSTMALIAVGWKPPLSKKLWLGMGLAISAILIWFGSYHIDSFPITFVEGQGVTAFKANYEYTLCFLNVAVAYLLWRRAENTGLSRYYLLALSSFVMGIGEISFTTYVTPSDFQNIFGHIFKLVAYLLLYRVAFVMSVRAPFEKIRQSEKRLRESEQYNRTLFESTPIGLALAGMDGTLLDVNPAFAGIIGRTVGETKGLTYWEITPQSYAEQEQEQLRQLSVFGRYGPYEKEYIHKDGHHVAVRLSGLIINRQSEQYIWSSVEDISARKQSEIDLRIAATSFESQESIMITDANRVIQRVNQAFTNETGYTAEEVIGRTPRLLQSGRHNRAFYHTMWETIRRTGAWKGEIWDRRKSGEIYPKWLTITAVKGEDGIVTHYVGSHIDITERKAAEEEINYLGFHDALTHLPNRRLLMDRLEHALATSERIGREGALLLIDLDNFKTLNDTLGHQIGDLLLQQVAQRLESCMRDGDTVARLGGDEFVVVMENLAKHTLEAGAQTEAISEKIFASLSQPYQLETYEYNCTASIGATLFNDKSQATDELLKQADIAMYQAKKAGRNTLRFFDPQMQASITVRVALEGELRKALEQQQFHLYYQIQVDSSHRPLGAEVLIRWIHPERGMVSPAQFIPLAEETGLILPIGQWALETACAQLKAWEQDALTRDLVLAVNVSARQFHLADFVAQVQAIVQRHAINPKLLKLELTEGMLLENIEEIINKMHEIQALGVGFSMDDFGTGYSSLQYLKRLPLDQIKIDQSFVRDITTDPNDASIVQTIIVMAGTLGLSVVAEGVETEVQREFLELRGCTHFQGYLFGRPVPIAQFEELLKQG